MCTVINNVETSRRNSYTCLHPFTYWRQMRKSHSDAIEIALKKLVYLASIRLRGTEMAAIRNSTSTVTSRQYSKRAIFVSGDVRFQDGDAVDLGKLRGTAFSRLLLSFNVCTLRMVIMYTHRTTVLLWYSGLCDIRVLFMYDAC